MSVWSLLLGGQQPIGMAVNLLIIALFAAGCWDILRGFQKLMQEQVLVKRASASLLSSRPEAEGAGIPSQSPEALLDYLGVPEKSLLGHRIKRAHELRLAGMGNRDVLQLLTSEKLGSYGSLARQVGASLTLLGLLGTVFGLSLALLNIGDASNIKGVEDLGLLSKALGGTMGGMKTAFGCTLAGLLTALLLSFLNFGLRGFQSKVLTAIEEFTACDLLRALERVDPESDNATKAFANVLAKVSGDLVSLGGNLMESAKEYRSGSSEVRETLAKLVQSVNDFSSTISRVAGNQVEFTETMKSTRDAVDGVGTVVKQSSELLMERLDLVRKNADATAKVEQSLLSHHEEFKRLADVLKTTYSEGVKVALGAQEKATGNLIEKILQEHAQGLRALIDQSQQSMKSILEQNRALMTSVSDILIDARLNENGRSKAVVQL